ncbi:MAG: MBL fold metallo-hydrolase [Chitinophagaceae bacterium]|nr:MBL fold metallo-hydrolase [Chitinophagaceae bacterium]
MKRFIKILKRTMLIILSVILVLALITVVYIQQPQFGKHPEGARLALIERSPHYKDGRFRNRFERPTISEGYSIMGELYKTVFKSYPSRQPIDSLPSVKTDLKQLPVDSNLVIWMGHSTIFMQLNGKKILVDPVFSGKASPLPWGVKAYKGSDIYTTADMPEIDYLIISHDHYDHLDYETVVALKDKVKKVICGLGVGAHFEYWGYSPAQIIEKDWYEKIEIDTDLVIHTEPTHHDSGRGFKRGKTLWMSYMIQTPQMKIYISGDGGFDNRFAEIGKKYGPIDWAIIEDGQYDKAWQSVHNLPEEVMQAALDLQAKNVLPVHHSKFTLGKHPWNEPLKRITELSAGKSYHLVTPMIGQAVDLKDSTKIFPQWWVEKDLESAK